MKNKNLLIIDDEWESRQEAYEALRINIERRLENKGTIKFSYLERWADLGDSINPSNFDAIISDFFLESRAEGNNRKWPKSITVKDVLDKLGDESNLPVFVLSSQWNSGDDAILNEMVQKKNVDSLLLWQSVESEKDGKAYASSIMLKQLFPKTRYSSLEDDTVITVLHCSDFHCTKENIENGSFATRLHALYETLNKELEFCKGGELHFVCLGGDFVDKGSLNLYSELTLSFKNFMSRFSAQNVKPAVLSVPGNHDYNRESAKLLLSYPYLKSSIFYPYWNFAKSLSTEMESTHHSPDSLWLFEETAPLGFYFFGVNTELQDVRSCRDEVELEEFKGIVKEEDIEDLRIAHARILSNSLDKKIIPIGLMHRTINPKTEFAAQGGYDGKSPVKHVLNFNRVENVLTKKHASSDKNVPPIFLCGDLHASTANSLLGGKSKGLVSSAPPFMGAPESGTLQGFNLIYLRKVNGEIAEVSLNSFSYNREDQQFEKQSARCKDFEIYKGQYVENND